jgi:integrase
MARKAKYYQRKDGLFEAIRTVNGKRVAFRGKTCREVDRKMLEYQEKGERGRTFDEVAREWYESRLPGVSMSTAASYENALRPIVETLGKQHIKDIKPIQCQRILDGMGAQGFRLGTVKLAKTVLIQTMRYAVIHGDIDVSPAAEIRLPRDLERTKRDALTAEQIKTVTECRSGDWWLLGLAFLWTGCRRGELMALRYEDIDRKAGTITINKKYTYVRGK